jgi:hypothetical protein
MFTDNTGWRRKAFKHPDPVPDAADTAANDNVTEGANEETSGPVSDQDVVLDEQEQDEADVTAFVDHRDAEPNER